MILFLFHFILSTHISVFLCQLIILTCRNLFLSLCHRIILPCHNLFLSLSLPPDHFHSTTLTIMRNISPWWITEKMPNWNKYIPLNYFLILIISNLLVFIIHLCVISLSLTLWTRKPAIAVCVWDPNNPEWPLIWYRPGRLGFKGLILNDMTPRTFFKLTTSSSKLYLFFLPVTSDILWRFCGPVQHPVSGRRLELRSGTTAFHSRYSILFILFIFITNATWPGANQQLKFYLKLFQGQDIRNDPWNVHCGSYSAPAEGVWPVATVESHLWSGCHVEVEASGFRWISTYLLFEGCFGHSSTFAPPFLFLSFYHSVHLYKPTPIWCALKTEQVASSIPGSVGYISYPMFVEPQITWVSSVFSGYINIWLDTKIVFKKDNSKFQTNSISFCLELFPREYYGKEFSATICWLLNW